VSGPPSDWGGFEESRPNGKIDWLGRVQMREVTYVERPLLQDSTFHLLAGRPSVGKGALCARWVSRCTNGEMYGRARTVLWLASEDDAAIDLGPRVEVAGGNRMRVALIPESFQLPRDVDWLRATAQRLGDVGLCVIDPVSGHIRGTNSNDDDEVRMALLPLGLLAAELQIPIIGIRHVSTKEAKGGLLAKILGSTAWVGVPRVVLGAAKEGADLVHVHPIKGNRVASAGGQKFRLEARTLPMFTETTVCAVLDGVSNVDIDAVFESRGNGTAGGNLESLVLAVLRGRFEVDEDQLAALVAEQSGAAAKAVRSVCFDMRDKGWIRSRPQKDEWGNVTGWSLSLTNAAPTHTSDVSAPPVDARTLDEALQDPAFMQGLVNDGIVESIQ
jgi:hypothetical protein